MLFGGLEGLIPLTKDEILKRISQKEIFSILFGSIDIKVNIQILLEMMIKQVASFHGIMELYGFVILLILKQVEIVLRLLKMPTILIFMKPCNI